jgi:hypothetical protein
MKHSADHIAKFLRAHSRHLNTGEAPWPYVNSARAISEVNNQAADLLDGRGLTKQAECINDLKQALYGIVGYWRQNPDRKEMEEFIIRAEAVLSKHNVWNES